MIKKWSSKSRVIKIPSSVFHKYITRVRPVRLIMCGFEFSAFLAPIELNFVLPDRHNFAGIFHLVKLHVQFDVLVCQDDFAVFETTFAP